ncbi:LPS export ABC transporter ATP-binding protein [Spectribacter hydrogenoxidans]|uniref:Lipopolysaccharide export system ATP-binding protein LptB n=1 Tax=Spectribacter hydrogenoxidans TaxID=3075608 RepID=A0ABU3BXH7_9GAMM|nr:LPS export ABC transporter ATP-binding protein [Salinisphaera sp. W335]MDT0633844.1 LPS export ABC transporter ATP-binding protein [Salinisphaera sp. W335]
MVAEARRLEAERLSKRFRGRPVVRDVSLQVASGEVVGLLGPNGAGKTTSFYMIVGLINADTGRIRLGDEDLTRAPMHIRARAGVGYLPQEASIFRKLSVADNIMAILETRRDLGRTGRRARLDNLLEELSIGHIRDAIGLSLSGGERRRVEIARALAAEPAFMLLDEPFAGIDPISIGDIRAIVRHLQARGIGILITDHNVRETLGICDRAYIMSDGEVIAAGDANTVLANEQVRRVYLGDEFRL